MKKKENYFLKIITLESVFFLIFICIGMFFFSFLEAKGSIIVWQKEESLVWQDYFTATKALEGMIQSNEKENSPEKELTEYEKVSESEKTYVENVKLSKKDSRGEKIQSQKLGTSYIQVKKTGIQEVWGQLEHNYMQKKVSIVLYGNSWENFAESDITVIWEKRNYELNESDNVPISLHTYQYQQSGQEELKTVNEKSEGKDSIVLEFDADKIFCYQLYQDEDYVYITIRNPKEVYDGIVVIDAGHGGKDTGTYAKNGDWDEKDFNLDFVKKVEESWKYENIKLYFSRLEDTEVTLVERVNFANDLKADLFVSLHCNSSDENSGNGLEVLYKNNEYATDSRRFAKKCLEALVETTGFLNRGLLKGNRIYIIRNAKMPTVLLELGFLSDSNDLDYLSDEGNRKEIAETICQVIWERFR